MKKVILVISLTLAAIAASAQSKAVGVVYGPTFEASYQHYAGPNDNFVECNLGYSLLTGDTDGGLNFGALNAMATYNFMCCRPEWTRKGEWGVYAGPGAYLGIPFIMNQAGISYGVTIQVGIEYTFEFPVQVSLALRPMFGGVSCGGMTKYNVAGLMGFIPTIGVRYCF